MITNIQGTFTLHNGVQMPYLGLGVYLSEEGKEVEQAVHWALETGYRNIDTASFYGNEAGVGRAVRHSGLPREEVFVTSKVWNSDQGYDTTLQAFERSMALLGLDVMDLYLVHWPVAGKYKDTWRALETLYEQGKVRAIGISNFLRHQLEDLLEGARIRPMVNQMEFHPYLVQQDLLDFCKSQQIQYQAWSPLMQGNVFQLPELKRIAGTYGKSIAQLVLRWNLQKGVATIPKSSKETRIRSNADLFDFEISQGDMAAIDALDRHQRFGPDPDIFDF
ncbi:aldo/keto reductase [Robiginitalea sediminis]|uniref:aldo/keto reductase n=1 Tax=Robiginitalea sediminis TaxID=1982593 RepID=UPI000B4BC823|nr:aldo/keto reductase [Robiginitalea sediminis]